MISTKWLIRRRAHWVRLQELLERVNASGLHSLSRVELREITLLYRQSAADLSTLRQDPSGRTYEQLVHQLLRRAHNLIYASEKPARGVILHFVTHGFPEVFVRNLNFMAAATCLFFAASLLGCLLTIHDPDFAVGILGPAMISSIDKHEMWTHSVLAIKPAASSMIMTNNISVGILTFAGGILGGLGTVWLLFFNGLLLGVIGAACWMHTMSLQLWSFVAPHGVLELPAIFIAGGAGLRLAKGFLFPGYLPRRSSVVAAGTDAVRLLLGTVPILIVAGIIEGFVSPTGMPAPMKFALAAGLFVLFLAYLFSPRLRATKAPHGAIADVSRP